MQARRLVAGPRTLLLLSGGIDSAYCLWRFLEDTDETLRVHHVELSNFEGRQALEAKAVAQIFEWVVARGQADRLIFTHSGFAYGSIRKIAKDVNIWALMVGLLMFETRSIERVLIPRHSDTFRQPADVSPTALKNDRLYREVARMVSGRVPQLVFPEVLLSKAQVVAQIPQDLLDRCWWCRRPVNDRPCHQCRTCQQVEEGLLLRKEKVPA